MISRPIVEAGEKLGFLPGPQPLTASVLTASGWTTMGQIKLGDKVIGRDGLPTEVIGVYPKGKKDTYKVTTTDGTSTECCLDHLWNLI
jgi:phosphate starvation-inducible PhoH-like protein